MEENLILSLALIEISACRHAWMEAILPYTPILGYFRIAL
jgi:hypothetical protein